jgi:hypothetical protein
MDRKEAKSLFGQPPKRRKPPERYTTLGLKFVGNLIKTIDK